MNDHAHYDFDEVLMSRARLAILSALVSSGEMEFTAVRDLLGLTQGNLSVHASKLQQSGYLFIRKDFVANKPRTTFEITSQGRSALVAHLQKLKAILGEHP
ncbi:MAG: transcriptional regulator [Planctomycetes bacterium]|nr:transcriptional regulator [Planctomycetota bacterium]